ncbi:MAG: hypothetical protein IJ086_10210, partial [Clostridium sp.]|nr:hypothetical protein [Clostridium sp.]
SSSSGSSTGESSTSSSRPIFSSGRYYGGYSNPFRYMGYRMGLSSWITNIIIIITVIVVLYIVIDYIRSKRD